MIRSILCKDARLLWPLIVLVTLIQACLEWVWYRYGAFGDDLAARELVRPLTVAWFVATCSLTVAIVQQDAVPGLDQDWLIRPIARLDLLLSKLLLALGAILVPMLALNVARALATGFAVGPSLEEAAIKEALVAGWLLLPVAALAATAATLTELLVLGAAIVAVYAGATLVSAVLLGGGTCPTCDTGIVWIEHTMQHVGVLAGACVILGLQYFRRWTPFSRALALAGALAVAWLQLPWRPAFAIESRLSPQPGSGRNVVVALEPRTAGTGAGDPEGGSGLHPRSGWTALIARTPSAAPVRLDLPVRISGMGSDERVFVDRSYLRLSDPQGHALYQGINEGMFGQDSLARPDAAADQAVLLPAAIYRRVSGQPVRLKLEYSLTLFELAGRYRLAAEQGTLQAPEVGRCATRLESSGLSIIFRCRQIGPAPFCFSAVLLGPDGRRDPEVWKCDPDYRPDLPGFTNVLRFYGLEVPVRDPLGPAQLPVSPAELSRSYLLVSFYGVRDHLTRTLVMPDIRLAAWR